MEGGGQLHGQQDNVIGIVQNSFAEVETNKSIQLVAEI